MNLSKYEILAEVVKQRSLTLAARQLGCTQSAVSHSIDSLEKELGFPVLKRSRAGVRLTDEGERLMPAVRALLSSAEQWVKLAQTGRVKMKRAPRAQRVSSFTSPLRRRAMERATVSPMPVPSE